MTYNGRFVLKKHYIEKNVSNSALPWRKGRDGRFIRCLVSHISRFETGYYLHSKTQILANQYFAKLSMSFAWHPWDFQCAIQASSLALARYKWLCRDQRYTQHSRLTILRSNLWSVEIFWLYFDNVLKWKISVGDNNTRPAELSGQVSRDRTSRLREATLKTKPHSFL